MVCFIYGKSFVLIIRLLPCLLMMRRQQPRLRILQLLLVFFLNTNLVHFGNRHNNLAVTCRFTREFGYWASTLKTYSAVLQLYCGYYNNVYVLSMYFDPVGVMRFLMLLTKFIHVSIIRTNLFL